jgi:hypothetical protein
MLNKFCRVELFIQFYMYKINTTMKNKSIRNKEMLFLKFIEKDMQMNKCKVKPLTQELMDRVDRLVKDIKVDLDRPLWQ